MPSLRSESRTGKLPKSEWLRQMLPLTWTFLPFYTVLPAHCWHAPFRSSCGDPRLTPPSVGILSSHTIRGLLEIQGLRRPATAVARLWSPLVSTAAGQPVRRRQDEGAQMQPTMLWPSSYCSTREIPQRHEHMKRNLDPGEPASRLRSHNATRKQASGFRLISHGRARRLHSTSLDVDKVLS